MSPQIAIGSGSPKTCTARSVGRLALAMTTSSLAWTDDAKGTRAQKAKRKERKKTVGPWTPFLYVFTYQVMSLFPLHLQENDREAEYLSSSLFFFFSLVFLIPYTVWAREGVSCVVLRVENIYTVFLVLTLPLCIDNTLGRGSMYICTHVLTQLVILVIMAQKDQLNRGAHWSSSNVALVYTHRARATCSTLPT